MTINPSSIELTPSQKHRLAEVAERMGKDYSTVLDELLSSISLPPTEVEQSGEGAKSLLEALEAIGAIGCFDGPSDLSTNPKHMEGFGTNARNRDSY